MESRVLRLMKPDDITGNLGNGVAIVGSGGFSKERRQPQIGIAIYVAQS